MKSPAKTDAFGCQLGKLDDDRQIAGRNINFYRKASDAISLGQVSTSASDRGYLIGLSLMGGHKRRIFSEHHATFYDFEENSIYLRNFAEDYKADLKGSFSFILMEISSADLERIAHGADVSGIPDLTDAIAKPDPVLGGLARAMFSIQERAVLTSPLLVDQLSAAIGIHLLQTYGNRPTPLSGRRLLLSASQEAKAKDYLATALPGEASIDHAADACGLSRVAFIRAFHLTTGQSPHDWLMNHRISKARTMLLVSKMALSDIATACGFADIAEFTRIFVKATGIAPGAFRRARLS
ncbi:MULTISPECIES: helix-turn-helix domain-containing protein [Rhizobium]|uniref:AraC family transcriptional regulator n=1 Tax=Rhizobium favelukesii TaxID=348824 RepID=W6S8W8_9HYPH|nr:MULTISPECIES: AraC family transcriptional regulator [Rhizobium]MCA0805592.1 AraC family transcriptional regulator [Rhizobium sp. T1473]MCS0459246.1 AraC family transcriptional regulator [Rhizobium favelukesii]UFS79067.1 AraC family transcriptional regulator [Rhizobium sp. T136]CDM62561.1 putative AraC family transcriptional regulator [Rhizobium favelukesii]